MSVEIKEEEERAKVSVNNGQYIRLVQKKISGQELYNSCDRIQTVSVFCKASLNVHDYRIISSKLVKCARNHVRSCIMIMYDHDRAKVQSLNA